MSDQNTSPETLIEFPCHFPIKVIEIIKQKNGKFDPSTIEMKGSSEGRYISLTCFVYVTSKPELDDIYRSLSSHPMIKVVL